MKEPDRIREQLQRVHRGPAWHGPSVLEAVDGVTAAQASARPIPSAHTIGELVGHIAAWRRIVRRRIAGERFEVPDSEDWPPFAGGAEAWQAARAELEAEHVALVAGLDRLAPARLDEPATPGGQTCAVQLFGVTQHDTYHAGQIVLLRKLAG